MLWQTLKIQIGDFMELIKSFSPAWFASVMGTGILAITSFYYSSYLSVLSQFAFALFYFNVALFFILLLPWSLRWIMFTKDAMADLEHPVTSNFYATMGIGMLILAANFILLEKSVVLGKIFWLLGTSFTIFFGLVTPYIMFKGDHVKLDHINPAWFIPPVGLIVIPVSGGLLIPHFSGFFQEFVIFINYFGWGAGFFIFISLMAICFYRFILHNPLPNTLAPTIWINLGPIGAGTVSLINLVKNSTFITVKEPFFVFGLIFWGFGIWWVLMAIFMTIHYIKRLELPYAMSWWGFTFPLGAYVAASHIVSLTFGLKLIDYIGFSLFWLLVFLWSVTFVKTIIHQIIKR